MRESTVSIGSLVVLWIATGCTVPPAGHEEGTPAAAPAELTPAVSAPSLSEAIAASRATLPPRAGPDAIVVCNHPFPGITCCADGTHLCCNGCNDAGCINGCQ
jgi:hypothetical protein